ncbi:MAG TPA: hypothetical protein VML19_00745 [Verrucomicrobiae bacterium]|nr:hypothetical protein [Verrucomicrobiae bacterium]
MKWALLILGIVAGAIGLVALIGAMLPQRHHATRRARYRVRPDALYAVLAGAPDWRTGVKSFGALPEEGGRKRWWEEDTHGQKITYELMEDTPPSKLAVRIADRSLPFGGTWTFEITPEGSGAVLRITEDGEVYNVIFRFMARFVFGYTGSIEMYLKDLAAKFGQAVTIEA